MPENRNLIGSVQPVHFEGFAQRLELVRRLEDDHFWFAGRRELIRRLLHRFVRPGARTLDVGAGSGRFVRELREEGFRAVGIDPLADSGAVVRGDGLRLPLRAESVDAVTLLDVLEHVDDVALLREVHRVVRGGGIVLMSVPASARLWSLRDVAAGHRRRYSRRSLETLASMAGLRPLLVTHYQFFLFPLMVIARTAARFSSRVHEVEEKPGAIANALFRAVNLFEARCAPGVRWPWGSSLVAVCEKR